jgi:lysozyme
MNPHRLANMEAVGLLKQFEGFHADPFLDLNRNIWLIGHGHTRTIRSGMKVTLDEADYLLTEDMKLIERAVDRLVKVGLTDNQFSALVCFVFDYTLPMFERSNLLRLLNRGWYEQVTAQLMYHTKRQKTVVPFLVSRREAEKTLWNKPINMQELLQA